MVAAGLWTARTGTVLLTSVLLLGDLHAQTGLATRGQGTETRGPLRRQRQLFDKVIGIIGDRVILASTIDEELRAIEESGTPMNDRERQDRGWNILMRIAREEIWVQYANIIGGENPEEFKQYIDRLVARRMTEAEQSYGSFTRFNEELGNIGESFGEIESEFRNQVLSSIGRSSALGQPSQRSPLMVTPKAMRRYFDENPENFSIQGEAEFAWMTFSSDDDAKVSELMAAAAMAWAKEEADPEQIAGQFGGRFRGMDQVRDDPDDHHAEPIKSFVLAARLGEVSQPIRLGRSYRLLKVTARTHAEEETFADPKVQARILLILKERKFRQAQNRVIQQKSGNLLIWPLELRDALTRR